MKKKMKSTIRSDWSGQFFAAGELFRRGYWTSVTVGNVPSTDLLVMTQKGVLFRVEVKATRGRGTGQFRPQSMESSVDLFYIFVESRPKEGFPPPKYWVMTSSEVSKILKKQERRGVKKPEVKRKDLPPEEGGWDKLPDCGD